MNSITRSSKSFFTLLRRSLRCYATAVPRKPRGEGTIASVFASLSGEAPTALPPRFQQLKHTIIPTPEHQQRLLASFTDLCHTLKLENEKIIAAGQENIPEIPFSSLTPSFPASTASKVRKSGVVIVRGVVPEQQALSWLEEVREYIATNPSVKGFPADDKQVFELYWSKPQLQARSHPSSLHTQKSLLNLFSTSPTSSSSIDLNTPLTYCDRLRIRNPGDSKFALGPHVDGGSIERWEDEKYRSAYGRILEGDWRGYNAWDVGGRAEANMNMYDGPGACGVFRALQGWTSLSTTSPGEGHLRVYPNVHLSSSYMLLRPFFRPIQPRLSLPHAEFLHPDNWELDMDTSAFPNSPMGRSQEFGEESHPHLELNRTMTTLKPVHPGDQAWWHCDSIHSVESTHSGTGPSSVLYIPAVPLTLQNAAYIADQRTAFEGGTPPPDFPGGVGEAGFVGRGGEGDVGREGRVGMGLERVGGGGELVERCNRVLGFEV